MSNQLRRAAQYIRMSSDRQDLSPLIQREAIAAFATANGYDIIRSYEDNGKSGLSISNRPRLRQLLADVVNGVPFTEILVYDISRWGRFQDADAAAYYEYHCRLHHVKVVFTNESFANDLSPSSNLFKSVRRLNAAQSSRDLALKARAGQQYVVAMGFHMGALPPFGYRRCSVSADGSRRVPLVHGQRKLDLTDRIKWVLASEKELDLVRRICSTYLAGHTLEEIARLIRAEGWLTEKSRVVSPQTIRLLLTNEALIGNFVWGRKSLGGKVITSPKSRMNGSVPRIIDDATWSSIQERLEAPDLPCRVQRKERESGKEFASKSSRPVQLRLNLSASCPRATYRRTLGSAQQLRNHTSEFGRALCKTLGESGLPCGFDPRSNVLVFWHARVRIRLLWPSDTDTWRIERSHAAQEVQHVLVARMQRLYQPRDFFVVPLRRMTAFSREVQLDVPPPLARFLCTTPQELVERLSKLSTLAAASLRG